MCLPPSMFLHSKDPVVGTGAWMDHVSRAGSVVLIAAWREPWPIAHRRSFISAVSSRPYQYYLSSTLDSTALSVWLSWRIVNEQVSRKAQFETSLPKVGRPALQLSKVSSLPPTCMLSAEATGRRKGRTVRRLFRSRTYLALLVAGTSGRLRIDIDSPASLVVSACRLRLFYRVSLPCWQPIAKHFSPLLVM